MTHYAISRLTLNECRTYAGLRFEPALGLVALTGANGAGKTNLLEAISLLVPGRGLRAADFSAIARLGGTGAWAVAAHAVTPEGDVEIGTAWQPLIDEVPSTTRSVMVDGLVQRSSGALAQHLRMVWLTPAMDRLFSGSPGDRRRFLDRMVMLFDSDHGTRVAAFEKLMRERNRLLEEANADRAWLASLETQMVEMGVAIAAARVGAVAALTQHLHRDGSDSAFPWSEVAIEGVLESLVANRPALETEDHFRKLLHDGRSADRAAGRTLIGPHRSDLAVVHGPKAMAAEHCSTGEQKALLIGLVLAQARAIKAVHGGAPILLLDEIAAHLDEVRRKALFTLLEGLGGQCFMSGTEASLFDGAGASAVVYHVDNGRVFESV